MPTDDNTEETASLMAEIDAAFAGFDHSKWIYIEEIDQWLLREPE